MDLFQLFGRVVVENDDAIDNLKETADEAEKTGESAKKIGDGFTKSGKITKKHLEEIARKSGKTTDEVRAEAVRIAKSYEEAGMDSKSAMKKAFSDIEDAADKATKKTNDTSKSMVASFGKIATAAGVVVTAVLAIGKALVELADSTRDYRVEMAKLETAFVTAGHSAETATTTYQTLYSVLGETDQAVEAANMLARLCDTEEELAKMTNACVGIYATFGNSLPVEGLAEAANETAKVGTVTGQLADALNWVGISEDDFNQKLADCNTERERAALITQTMVEAYDDATQTYWDNNEAITEAYLAQERLNAAVAELGEACEPASTAWKNFRAALIEDTSDFFSGNPLLPGVEESASQFGTIDEITARLEELKAKRDDIYNVPISRRSTAQEQNLSAILQEITLLENKYNDLAEAERLAAEEAERLANEEPFRKFTEISNQYVADAKTLIDSFVATYEGIYDRVSGWYGLFDDATTNVTTNVEKMMAAMQSQIDFNNNYSANLQALKDYGLGSLSEAFQEYGTEGAMYAEAIVNAVEEAGGATTEEGKAIIQGFTDMNNQITTSQEELSQTMALMNGEFETELQALNDNYEAAIADLDQSAEAAAAAKLTMEGLLNGLEAQIPKLSEKMGKIANQMTTSLQNGIGTIVIPFELYGNAPGFKTGLEYVPYDEFPAMLHKGEAVLTAEEASAWRAGKEAGSSSGTSGSADYAGNSGITVVQNITAVAQTPVELASATAAYFEQARWTL